MSKLIVFRWRPQPCPNVYDSNKSEWTSVNCRQGDKCRYCHNNREYQYHVLTYKTVLCLNLKNGGVCPQGLMCAFAHSQSERRKTKQFQVISNNSSCSTYLKPEVFFCRSVKWIIRSWWPTCSCSDDDNDRWAEASPWIFVWFDFKNSERLNLFCLR